MQQSGSGGSGNQGNMQKIGEGLGGLVGQAADNAFGMFGAMMGNMGGWWAQAANPQQGQAQGGGTVQASFNTETDNRCRTHFEAHGRAQGSSAGGASGSTAGGVSGGGASGSTQSGLHVDAQGSKGGGLHIDAQSGSSGRTRSYEDVRPLYQFGHMASQNPDYRGRGFHEVEPDLQRHWGNEQSQQHGPWPDVRGFVEFGYSGDQQKP